MAPEIGPQPSWLLLLPRPPRKVTLGSIRKAYGPTISQVLRKAADISLSLSTITILDIAVPCYEAVGSKSFHYSKLQNLLGQLYSLTCLLCAENSIDIQYGNDVDVRVLLFEDLYAESPSALEGPVYVSSSGPIGNLQQLACCGKPWQRVCSVDADEGEILLQLFLRLRNPSLDNVQPELVVERFANERLSPEISSVTETPTHNQESRAHHASVAVGGTFDHLHNGHKLLLSMTALTLNPAVQPEAGRKRAITVGITGDKLLENKKFREHLQDWHQRQAAVQAFLLAFLGVGTPVEQVISHSEAENETQQRTILNSLPSDLTIKYAEIFDAFGPTITDESISALVLSGETRAGGKAVNERRAENGWPALDIFEVDVLNSSADIAGTSKQESESFENKISSTEIRRRLGKRLGTED
ncbi:MAG: hypothetical protein Q9201_003595 [Fulgogasparrea decipioides]